MISWHQRSKDLQQDILVIEDKVLPLMLWIIDNDISLPKERKKSYVESKLRDSFENLKIVKL